MADSGLERYKITRQVGKGATSEIFLVFDLKLETTWAMKKLDKKLIDSSLYYREVEMLKKLKHKALPRIVDVLEDENYIYTIRDYMVGECLQKYIDFNGQFDFEELLNFVHKMVDILDYLHSADKPIIYRDLKPSNIIYSSEGEVSLIDFGITRNYDSSKSRDTCFMGTVGYAAPELFGKGQSDNRTDIYALGATLYFLATSEHYKDVPNNEKWRKFESNRYSEIARIIKKCMNEKMEFRYQNVREIEKEFIEIKNTYGVSNLSMNKYRYFYTYSNIDETEMLDTFKSNIMLPNIKIGIMGYKPNVGSTHIAMLTAISFVKLGYKVRIIDNSGNDGILNYEKFLEDEKIYSNNNETSLEFISNKITFLKKYESRFINKKYDIDIIDYGSQHYKINDFLRNNYKFLILPSNSYAYSISNVIIPDLFNTDTKFIVNLSDLDNLKKMKKWLCKDELYNINYTPNILENDDVYQYIIDDILKLNSDKKKGILNNFLLRSKK